MSQRHAVTLSDGTVIYGIIGGDGEDEDEQDADPEDDAQEGGDEGEGDGEDSADDPETLKQQLAEALASKAEVERRMRMADRTAARYRTENEELKRGKTQAEANAEVSLEDEVKLLRAKLAEKQDGDSRGKIRDDFLLTDKYAWANKKVAFDLLDISDVQVDDKGRVDSEALADAMDRLATDHPYLVKPAEKKDDAPKNERPSGSQPGAHRRDRKQVDAEALKKKYPQLNRS